MEGADDGNVQSGSLLQQCLHLGAVLAYDADVVPAGLVCPVLGNIQRAEFAEAVGGEEHPVAGVVGHDDFRPVNHGCGHEGQGVLAQSQGIALTDHNPVTLKIVAEELLHHGEGLGGGNHRGLGIDLQEVRNVGRMIRLHVLNDQIVGLPAVQDGLQIVQPLVREIPIHGVHNGHLLIQNHIRIVRHAVGNHILSLKQVYLMVVNAHIADILGNCHRYSPLCRFADVLAWVQYIRKGSLCQWNTGGSLDIFRRFDIMLEKQ